MPRARRRTHSWRHHAWQNDAECRSGAGLLDRNATAVRLHGPFGDGETETCAAHLARPSFVDTIKPVEDPRPMFRRNPRSFVDDGHRGIARIAIDLDVDGRSRRAVFDRVVEQVRDSAPEDQPWRRYPNCLRHDDLQSRPTFLGENTE